MAKNTQIRLITGGCQRRDTEKATCCSGFPKTVVSLGKKTPHLWRTAPETIQRLHSPGTHLQHGYRTWGLTPTEWARFDGFHRRQPRQVIRIRYPEKISSNARYERCECDPMSLSAIKAWWGLFGHVMRMAHDTPAQMAIDEYIPPTATAGWQGRPCTILPTTLDNDLQGVGKWLRNKQDLHWHLRTIASDRNQWRNLAQEIMKAAQAKLIHS